MTLTLTSFAVLADKYKISVSNPQTTIVREIEQALDGEPENEELRAMLAMAFDRLLADEVAVAPHGIRRERLVRWDRWSTTWNGHDKATGRSAQVRILKSHCRNHPVALRVIERDAARLYPLMPELVVHPDGMSICAGEPRSIERERPLFAAVILKHTQWRQHGLGWPEDLASALHVGPNGVDMLCLTPLSPQTNSAAWDHITAWLNANYDLENIDAHHPVLRALTSLPGGRPDRVLATALRQDLVRQWHTLRVERSSRNVQLRADRFGQLLERLHKAMPAPSGRAALGVNQDGTLTTVEGSDGTLSWGTVDERTTIAQANQPLNAPASRQLLRTRAMASPSAHLQTQADGDARYLEHATQWVATSLQLRTLRLLLQRQRPD